MIRNTETINGLGTISAYSDNAAVLEGHPAAGFGIPKSANQRLYQSHVEDMAILVKVETHNHLTAVSPYPGAATDSGGEIRDEGAVGRGSKPKAGLAGFTVSNLPIPGFEQPWANTLFFCRLLSAASSAEYPIPLSIPKISNVGVKIA